MFHLNYVWLSPLDLLRFIILRSLDLQRRFRTTYNFLLYIMRIIFIVAFAYFMLYLLCLLFVVILYSCLLYIFPNVEFNCNFDSEDEKDEERQEEIADEADDENEDEEDEIDDEGMEEHRYQIGIHMVANEDNEIPDEEIIPLPDAHSPPASVDGDAAVDDEIETPIDRNEQGDSEYQIGELVMGDHEPQEYGDHSVDVFDLDEEPFDGWE